MPARQRESLPYSFARFTQTLKRIVDPVVRRSRFSRFVGRRNEQAQASSLLKRMKQSPPIFVYQMGKVASTSIYESLRDSCDAAVFHAHYFSAYHSDLEIRVFHDYYIENSPPLKLISLVREPVTRNISAFFQNFRRDTGIEISKCNKSMLELRGMFLKNYPHEIPWVWFDNNIKKHFGIDVYDYPFPDDGFQFIRNDNIDLLLMRHDLEDETKQLLIAQHVELDSFKIVNSNVSSNKNYANYLNEFNRLKLPIWYLHRLSSTKYMKHFFGSETGQIIREWREVE